MKKVYFLHTNVVLLTTFNIYNFYTQTGMTFLKITPNLLVKSVFLS